jgi:hypothetical protein
MIAPKLGDHRKLRLAQIQKFPSQRESHVLYAENESYDVTARNRVVGHVPDWDMTGVIFD